MTRLEVSGLRVAVESKVILDGIDLAIESGRVSAVMGPNGSGKSTLGHVLAGRPGYEVLGGSVTLDGEDVLAMSAYERARSGLFLALQYPTEVPGVAITDVFEASLAARRAERQDLRELVRAESQRIGLAESVLDRSLNVDFSGGEKKRMETLQLAVLQPRIAILDELDSGLDIDALRVCARRVEAATHDDQLGVLAITHYSRLFNELKPDDVHILVRGRIVASGGPELADQLEDEGYGAFV